MSSRTCGKYRVAQPSVQFEIVETPRKPFAFLRNKVHGQLAVVITPVGLDLNTLQS